MKELLDMGKDYYYGNEDNMKSLEALSQNISKILSGREADQENPCFDYDDVGSIIWCDHSSFSIRYYMSLGTVLTDNF